MRRQEKKVHPLFERSCNSFLIKLVLVLSFVIGALSISSENSPRPAHTVPSCEESSVDFITKKKIQKNILRLLYTRNGSNAFSRHRGLT